MDTKKFSYSKFVKDYSNICKTTSDVMFSLLEQIEDFLLKIDPSSVATIRECLSIINTAKFKKIDEKTISEKMNTAAYKALCDDADIRKEVLSAARTIQSVLVDKSYINLVKSNMSQTFVDGIEAIHAETSNAVQTFIDFIKQTTAEIHSVVDTESPEFKKYINDNILQAINETQNEFIFWGYTVIGMAQNNTALNDTAHNNKAYKDTAHNAIITNAIDAKKNKILNIPMREPSVNLSIDSCQIFTRDIHTITQFAFASEFAQMLQTLCYSGAGAASQHKALNYIADLSNSKTNKHKLCERLGADLGCGVLIMYRGVGSKFEYDLRSLFSKRYVEKNGLFLRFNSGINARFITKFNNIRPISDISRNMDTRTFVNISTATGVEYGENRGNSQSKTGADDTQSNTCVFVKHPHRYIIIETYDYKSFRACSGNIDTIWTTAAQMSKILTYPDFDIAYNQKMIAAGEPYWKHPDADLIKKKITSIIDTQEDFSAVKQKIFDDVLLYVEKWLGIAPKTTMFADFITHVRKSTPEFDNIVYVASRIIKSFLSIPESYISSIYKVLNLTSEFNRTLIYNLNLLPQRANEPNDNEARFADYLGTFEACLKKTFEDLEAKKVWLCFSTTEKDVYLMWQRAE